MAVGDYVFAAFAILYGTFILVYFSLWALLDGSNWTSDTPDRARELEKGMYGGLFAFHSDIGSISHTSCDGASSL